jgi:sulfate/thiosulfate transport system permease protein
LTRPYSIVPGFWFTLGITLTWLAAIVLIPLAVLVIKGVSVGPTEAWNVLSNSRVLGSLWLSLWTSLVAAVVTMVVGLLIAWVLVRYTFPGRKVVDALIDIPVALPTAVAGIALTTLFAQTGWLGAPLSVLGVQVSFTPLGIMVALVFIGLPFVVRSVQPVLEHLDPVLEEAAGSFGASPWQVFVHVVFPQLLPALVAGGVMAAGRGVGEYGSVVFISANLPNYTETGPLQIVSRLEANELSSATVIALAMIVMSLVLLLVGNWVQLWATRVAGQA